MMNDNKSVTKCTLIVFFRGLCLQMYNKFHSSCPTQFKLSRQMRENHTRNHDNISQNEIQILDWKNFSKQLLRIFAP